MLSIEDEPKKAEPKARVRDLAATHPVTFIHLPRNAQGEGTQIAIEQVNQAVQEIQKLCQSEIQQNEVPGLAIAVVFQDRTPFAVGVVPGADYSVRPVSPAPALGNSAYLGTYRNNYFGEVQIIEKGDGLAIVEGPHNLTFNLQPCDRETFTCQTIGENAVGATGVTFTIGSNGKATTMVIENLNVRGEGNFQRSSEIN